MRVVFMGTPDFAAASLEALLLAGINIVAAYTQPDKPGNRMKKSDGPVKSLAVKNNIPVFQPSKLRDELVINEFRSLDADLAVTVAYGKILPDEMLASAKLGGINLHASLLPKYRGASPIQWAVLSGDKKTGVTTMHMDSDMDTGDIIYTAETEIGEIETSGGLLMRLRDIGAELLVKTVRDIEKGSAPRRAQDHQKASYTKMLTKEMSPIDWNKSPREIVKHICGLDPWPVATANIGGVCIRVFGAEYTENKDPREPGTIVSADKRGIEVICGAENTLLLTEVQAPGGKRMTAGSYILGHPIAF